LSAECELPTVVIDLVDGQVQNVYVAGRLRSPLLDQFKLRITPSAGAYHELWIKGSARDQPYAAVGVWPPRYGAVSRGRLWQSRSDRRSRAQLAGWSCSGNAPLRQ